MHIFGDLRGTLVKVYFPCVNIMSFLSQKVVFSRFNRKRLQRSSRSRTRIFGASNDDTESEKEQSEIQDPVERWNCVLRIIYDETILVLLNPVDNKSLKEVWEWAKANITMSYVRECLAANTKDNFPDDPNNRERR
jgi:hypothetical protein